MADWMELPNYSMATFRQQRQACRCRLATNDAQSTINPNESSSVRATYDEVRSYYIHYVKRNRLTNYFHNGYEITSLERVCVDAPFYDDVTEEIRTPEPLWEIRGYNKQNQKTIYNPCEICCISYGCATKYNQIFRNYW